MVLDVKITPEQHAALPEPLRAEYTAPGDDGLYTLDTRPFEADGQRWALENVSGLRSSLEAARNERQQARDALKSFEGVNVEDYRRLMSRKSEIENWDPSNDDAAQARLAEQNDAWQAKYDADLTEAQKKAKALDERYRKFAVRSAAVEALSKVAPKRVKVLLPIVEPMLDLYAGESGDSVYVKGEGGKPRITQQAGSTSNMTAIEVVESLRKDPDYADYFPGTGATGSGATGSGKGTGANRGAPPVDVSKLSPTEQLKQARMAQQPG